jgi:phage protein U
MIKKKLINIMLLFAVLSGNALADDTSSKAIYDSKLKTLSLEGLLVPFIDEFTGKETDNKGIFDVQLQEKTKLVFELIPWSINFKNTFNGENTSDYILYDHKTRSVKIPCFEVTTIAKFGDGIEGKSIYYKDVSMKQRHVAYPIFHVEDMTETDNCESSVIPEPEEPPKKPTLTTIPTTTEDDTVEVEVNGEDGTTVFVNGVDSGKSIDSTGKVKITLDTSGEAGDKHFSITLKDDKGNESEALSFVITKESIFIQKPTLTTTPTTTEDDTVEVEVNGEDGTTVFVNGVDSGKTIDSTGKVKITLDTSGEAGDKNFSISLKDDKGNESEALSFVITKESIFIQKPTLTTTPTTTEDDTVEVEVNGEDGTTVFVNGVDSGKTIDSTGKVKITLDTSGEAGDKNFSITLKDSASNESEAFTFVITKQSTLTKGLIAHYEFEGNANDSSGNGNHGTEHGGVSYTDGVIGKDFNAAVANKAHLQLKNTFNTNDLKSLSFWIYQYGKHNLDDSQILLSKYNWSYKHNFLFQTYDNKNDINKFCAHFYIELPNKNAKSDSICSYYNEIPDDANLTVYKNEEMDINRWHHISYIDDGKYMYIYMNGNLVAKRKRVYETYFSNNEPINIGYEDLIGGDFKYNYYLNSKIDDLRLYNRALSESEIKQLYKMGQQ